MGSTIPDPDDDRATVAGAFELASWIEDQGEPALAERLRSFAVEAWLPEELDEMLRREGGGA